MVFETDCDLSLNDTKQDSPNDDLETNQDRITYVQSEDQSSMEAESDISLLTDDESVCSTDCKGLKSADEAKPYKQELRDFTDINGSSNNASAEHDAVFSTIKDITSSSTSAQHKERREWRPKGPKHTPDVEKKEKISKGVFYCNKISHMSELDIQRHLINQKVCHIKRIIKRVQGKQVPTHLYIATFTRFTLPRAVEVQTSTMLKPSKWNVTPYRYKTPD